MKSKRISDAHGHLFSHRFFRTLAMGLDPSPSDESLYSVLGERLPFDFPPPDPAALALRWVEELDHHDVESMVVMASVPRDEDSVHAAALAAPGRLIPYFMVDPTADDAEERVERAFQKLGLKAMALFPAMHHFPMWDNRLEPLLTLARAARAAVFVHCGVLKLGIRDKLGLESRFDMRFANPIDLNGIAKAFPEIPFLIPHFGGGFFRELLMVASECANVYADSSSSNSWRAFQTTPLSLDDVFRQTIDVLGVERILYGSDSSFFPRGWQRSHFEEQCAALDAVGVNRQERDQILGGNLRRILDL